MKTTAILFLAYLALCVQCSVPENKSTKKEISTQPIKVGVFDGHGGAQTCIWETVAAIRLDPEMEVCTITTADIANNVLDSIDAIIIPGGSGKSQYLNLGTLNQQRIKDFIAKGKGAVGICAGAYLFSNTPDYTCIQLNGQQAIDIEHDNRGHGLAKFTLCEEGKKIFPELADRDTSFVIYYEGPVFINNPADTIQSNTLAIMESDVHEEGNAPANMTNGKPFFVANNYGKGRVFSSIAHPEGTPGMMWMIPRMVRWTLNKPFIPYQSSAVRPDLFNHESLMATDDLKQEEKAFQILLSGESEQKVAALDWLEAHHSWDAKRWVQGLLYDASPAVRIRAAPANMTNGKPFFVANNYGKGRVFSSIAHPEGTPGMMWMIPRMVRWTLNKPFIPYQSSAVRPDLFNHESLMATDDLKQEEKAFQILLSGESEQKVAALDWLEAHHSWDAKRWVQGLLYDASPAVRIRAARYIADTHYLPFLPNLQAAYRTETDKATQEELKTQLEKLTALLP